MKKKFFFRVLWVILYFCLEMHAGTYSQESTTGDSVINKVFRINGFLSTSLISNINWRNETFESFMLGAAVNLMSIRQTNTSKNIFELRSELSYVKFMDSIIDKSEDQAYITFIHSFGKRKRFKNSVSLSLKTQFTDTWIEISGNGISDRVWRSGPLLPAILKMGYGFNYIFRNDSYINFSVLSWKLETRPNLTSSFHPSDFRQINNKILYRSSYGMGFQTTLSGSLSKIASWEIAASFFTVAFDQKQTTFDATSMLSFKTGGSIRIRIMNRFAYDYITSEKIEMHSSFLLGYYIQKD